MKSILAQLYDGELCPADQTVCRDPAYSPTWDAVMEKLEHLAAPEDVEQIDTLIGSIAVMNSRAGFEQGIRLGMALAWELLGR